MLKMPTEHKMPEPVKWLSVVLAVVLGGGYAFGPDSVSSAPIFEYVKQLMPIWVWGCLFMVCGALLAFTDIVGYAVSATAWGLWGTLLSLGAHDGQLQSWGALIWPFYFAALMFWHVARWGMELRRSAQEQSGGRRRLREEDG